MQNGRINVAHARKKRRLDAELERILELIEQKRSAIVGLEDRIAEKGNDQNKREEEMVDLEKQLMMILMEQQKVSLGVVQSIASPEDRVKEMLTEVRIPWPPPKDANQEYVNSLFAPGGPLNRDSHPY
jgi:chromosome segregation ATPase